MARPLITRLANRFGNALRQFFQLRLDAFEPRLFGRRLRLQEVGISPYHATPVPPEGEHSYGNADGDSGFYHDAPFQPVRDERVEDVRDDHDDEGNDVVTRTMQQAAAQHFKEIALNGPKDPAEHAGIPDQPLVISSRQAKF